MISPIWKNSLPFYESSKYFNFIIRDVINGKAAVLPNYSDTLALSQPGGQIMPATWALYHLRNPVITPRLCSHWRFKKLFCPNAVIIHFRLYRERVTQIEKKLAEVKAGRAPEYLQPLEELQVNMKNRMEVSSIMRELRLSNITCKFDAEQLATEQNFEVRSIETMLQCGSPKGICIVNAYCQFYQQESTNFMQT